MSQAIVQAASLALLVFILGQHRRPAFVPDLASYDLVIVAMSGGKDSLACLLYLLALGVPRSKIELWHHDVDGREGSSLMDWPVTRAYCEAIAKAFEIPLYFSWREGGFESEMLRDDAPTGRVVYETSSGELGYAGGRGPRGTRGLFPLPVADLGKRFCSSALKIDVCAAAIRNQARFRNRRTLVVTGERAEESSARSKYLAFEPHRTDRRRGRDRRHVDHWRPVHAWSEARVWAILEAFQINVHPAYRLGWGRVSCAACIFASAAQWASLRVVNPPQFEAVARHEARSGKTISMRRLTVIQQADSAAPYVAMREEDRRAAIATTFDEPVFVDRWVLPAGAYGDSCGPT